MTIRERVEADMAAKATPASSIPGVDQCPDCDYSVLVHVIDGDWLGCPPNEAEAVKRWGRE